jgi:hypothetical protein
MSDPAIHGPIDVLVLEFPPGAGGAATCQAILDLIDRGTIRLYDLLIVRKGADGACTLVDLAAAEGSLAELAALAGAQSGLLGEDDVDDAASVLDPDTVGLVLVYENTWAIPFAVAALGEGGQMVATSRLTVQEIMDALDAAESAD